MKARVYKTQNGEVVVDTPAPRYQEENFDQCPHPGRFRDGAEPFTMEVKELSEIEILADGKNEGGCGQFYYDGQALKHDHEWEENIMNDCLIRSRHEATLDAELDAELEKNNPDPVVCLKKTREVEKLRKMGKRELFSLALAKLKKEGKKPKIQVKLEAKIAELEG